eukprot:XP_001707146.1 Hypothetical protein GL50803_91427 [Giardia lamblia ATCC 50803]
MPVLHFWPRPTTASGDNNNHLHARIHGEASLLGKELHYPDACLSLSDGLHASLSSSELHPGTLGSILQEEESAHMGLDLQRL